MRRGTTADNALFNLQQGRAKLDGIQEQIASGFVIKMLNKNQNTLKALIDYRKNVDYAKAATELNQLKIAFEAALSATAKISQLSLLDYLK